MATPSEKLATSLEMLIRLMWETMRESVVEHFPKAPKASLTAVEYMK